MAISDKFIDLFTQFVRNYENPGMRSSFWNRVTFSTDTNYSELKVLLNVILGMIEKGKDTKDEETVISDLNNIFLNKAHNNSNIISGWLNFIKLYNESEPQKIGNIQAICQPESSKKPSVIFDELFEENQQLKRDIEIYQKDLGLHRSIIKDYEVRMQEVLEENTKLKQRLIKDEQLQKLKSSVEKAQLELQNVSAFFTSPKETIEISPQMNQQPPKKEEPSIVTPTVASVKPPPPPPQKTNTPKIQAIKPIEKPSHQASDFLGELKNKLESLKKPSTHIETKKKMSIKTTGINKESRGIPSKLQDELINTLMKRRMDVNPESEENSPVSSPER